MSERDGNGAGAIDAARSDGSLSRSPAVAVLTLAAAVPSGLERAVAEAGMRLGAEVALDGVEPPSGSAADPSSLPEGDVVWCALGAVPPPAVEALVRARADALGHRLIVDAGGSALDWAFAALDGTGAQLVSAPSAIEQLLALRDAAAAVPSRAGEERDSASAYELRRLREEVHRIAQALSGLTQAETGRLAGGQRMPGEAGADGWGSTSWDPDGWPFANDDRSGDAVGEPGRGYRGQPSLNPMRDEPKPGVTSLDIRKMIRMRRVRDNHFPPDLFSDPAWDMLLDLMAARIDRRQVSVSSLCIAAAVPATTALRWIKTMTEAGLFERSCDPHDGRRVFITLSDDTAARMHAYFKDMLTIGSLLPV